MKGPGFTANEPTGIPGILCMPKTASTGYFSKRPSSTITFPPPSFSSAGWKIKFIVPSKLPFSAKYLAAPSNIVVCPSWPQACIFPGVWDLCSKSLVSWIKRASRSALKPIDLLPLPFFRVPTTPVPAIPVSTSIPKLSNLSATIFAVLCSSNAISGWACISLLQFSISGCKSSNSLIIFIN